MLHMTNIIQNAACIKSVGNIFTFSKYILLVIQDQHEELIDKKIGYNITCANIEATTNIEVINMEWCWLRSKFQSF